MIMIAVLVVAALIERFFDCGHLRVWDWYKKYQHLLAGRLSQQSSYLVLAASIIPVVLIVMLLAKLLHPFFFGAVHFVFSVVVLLYCFGPRNLWADAPASLDTLFIAANRRLFACIFWFVGLGIGGALLYRLIALAAAEKAEGVADSTESNVAYQIESYLDWPSIRLLTFVFALGGNFSRVFAFWRNKVISGVEANDTLLTTCGTAALPDPSQSEGMHLLDRSLIIFLIVSVVLILL